MIYAPHDYETRSVINLKKSNADVYAQHETTYIMCLAWAIANGPIRLWKPGDPDPDPFLDHIRNGGMLSAWNSYFEESIWRWVVPRTHPHWPIPTTEQFDDTMARAAACALPMGLDDCAHATGLGIVKDEAGHRIMMQLSRPRKVDKKTGALTWWEPETSPEKYKALYKYCKQDVRAERAQAEILPPLIPRERQLWLIDQKINRRGVHVDVEAVNNAIRLIDRETDRLNKMMAFVTRDYVPTVTAMPKLKTWVVARLKKEGCQHKVDSLDKAGVHELLGKQDLPQDVRKALLIRQEAGKTSTAKLKKMLNCIGENGNLTGEFAFHRATTGRWGGRGVQLHNLVRPKLKAREIAECIELFGDDVNGPGLINMGYGEPFDVVSWSVRGMLVPRPDHVFIGGDLSNIEGRTIAWLAGEAWKLDAFREYDRIIPGEFDKDGEPLRAGPDIYKLAYGRAFGVNDLDSLTDHQRQIGKVMELALGYQGGVGAFRTMAATYKANLKDIAAQVKDVATQDAWARAEERRQWLQVDKKMHSDLPGDIFTGITVLVTAWRENHPHIKNFWTDMEMQAMTAIKQRGHVFTTFNGLIKFSCGKDYLYCKLPSGRVMYYARLSLEKVWSDIFDQYQTVVQYYAAGKDKNGADLESGPNKFNPIHSYGGLLGQNATQGVARDILAEIIIRLESANYPVVLHVHDEARAEVKKRAADLAECARIMGTQPVWANGLPIAVGCETMARYHK